MSDRRNFTDRMKEIIFHSCDGHCFYCGKALSFKNHAPGKYTIGVNFINILHTHFSDESLFKAWLLSCLL